MDSAKVAENIASAQNIDSGNYSGANHQHIHTQDDVNLLDLSVLSIQVDSALKLLAENTPEPVDNTSKVVLHSLGFNSNETGRFKIS